MNKSVKLSEMDDRQLVLDHDDRDPYIDEEALRYGKLIAQQEQYAQSQEP